MGNDHSQLSGLEIEEKAIEVSDFWSQHSASLPESDNVTNLSVFIGEIFVSGSLWSTQTPLEKCIKNIMIYRHPCILKYVASWQKNSKFYSAVEEVTPLSHIISTLSTLQISIGLHSILKALYFLHDNASVSHNNICIPSIYVTKDGSWKLGGMEYLCRYKDMNCDYLSKTRPNRYIKSIDPNEDKLIQNNLGRKDFIDVYAFGVLACEILRNKSEDGIPALSTFCDYCKNDLQNLDLSKRPNFKSVLDHNFFSHDFIIIHSFLIEFPLKSDNEKSQFFQNLGERLRCFDEVLLASQLGALLLSRMVLLDITAQTTLLPLIFTPRPDGESEDKLDSLFSETTFKKYLLPRLFDIIKVHDAQIRLLLLHYFPNFMHIFTKEELQSYILPELLVGIKDTNDHLVSVTLRTLADLVPILGAATIIGGKRAKLFNDGRPMLTTQRHSKSTKSDLVPTSLTTGSPESDRTSLSSVGVESNKITVLPERPRPDGEEGETSTEEIEQSVDEDLDNWADWDINENPVSLNGHDAVSGTDNHSSRENIPVVVKNDIENESVDIIVGQSNTASKREITDILELDIKNQLNKGKNAEEFDFFQDMEPVIHSCNKFLINESDSNSTFQKEVSKKLALHVDDSNPEGWGDGDWE